MKILHVTKKYPHALGGDAVVVANLQKQQIAAGHYVAIVTSNCAEIINNRRVYKVGVADSPEHLDAITIKRLLSLLILSIKMFGILQKERPDIMHTHSIDMAFFASFAARFYRIPIVHTFHIVTFYDANQSMLRRKSELWLAKKARLHRITAPNDYDVTKLRAGGLQQAALLPNGVDTNFWTPNPRVAKDDIFMFLAIGRLEAQKGYEYLIKAVRLLFDMIPMPFRVVIVGEGSQQTALHNLARDAHVEHIITFTGRKNPQEIRTLFAQAGAAIFPSLYETTPLTMLEAWSAGVPVIITPVGIVRDAPSDFNAAYIVPPQNEHALMQAMGKCMADAEVRTTIAANGSKEVKKYAWPTIAQSTESLYRGVAK